MKKMNIVVCIKQVPDTTEIKLDPATGTMIREGVPSIMNPDDKSGLEMALELKDKYEANVTVITITHYMDEVVEADKVYVINDGKIALSGTPQEIFSHKSALKEFGLELPLATQVADELIAKGVNLPENILTDKQLAEALCALK